MTPDRHHPYLRGRTNNERAHALLDERMRERILEVFPIKPSQRHSEREYLNRIARWIERLTLAATKAPRYATAEERKEHVRSIRSSAKAFGSALIKTDGDTRKRMYTALSKQSGDVLGDFAGDDFARGRKRYQQILRAIRLVRTAAAAAIQRGRKGPIGAPIGEVMEVLKAIWVEATGLPFSYSTKPRKDEPRQTDRAYQFVIMILDIADEAAAKAGRKMQPLGGSSREGTIRNAMRVAQKSTGLRTDNRSKKTKDSDRNTYRIR